MNMKRTIVIAATVALLALPALAQQAVNERRAASPTGTVEVSNIAGSVRVIGWSQGEVEVTGTLGRGTERLDFSGPPERILVKVVVPEHTRDLEGSNLTVKVPAGCRLEVEAVSADITVEGLTGVLELDSVSGEITVAGDPGEIEAESVSGDIDLSAKSATMRLASVSGSIKARGARGEVTVETVSGNATVEAASADRVELESVSGTIRFAGELSANSRLDAESVSGTVEVSLPAGTGGSFRLQSFSGDIENELGPPARRTAEYGPGSEADFTTGSGGVRVEIETMSGTIRLRKR
jgi:DUF4097 and DUF4098 domain-containing protein YvlB